MSVEGRSGAFQERPASYKTLTDGGAFMHAPPFVRTRVYLLGMRVPSFTGGSILMFGPWTIGSRPAP